MAEVFVKSGSGVVELSAKVWAVGERMVPLRADASSNVGVAKRWVWECTTAGTNTGTPVWSSSVTQDVTTVTDNGVVWTARRPGFSSGSTVNWIFASPFLDYMINIVVAGDTLYVSNNHAEIITATTVYAWPGTYASPNRILCVDDTLFNGSGLPSTLADTATITLTGSPNSIQFTGYFYCYGITISNNTINSSAIWLANGLNRQVWEKCTFQLNSTSSSNIYINAASTSSGDVFWKDVFIKLGATGSQIVTNSAHFRWEGGGISAGSLSPTGGLIQTGTGRINQTDLAGVDFSNLAATFALMATSHTGWIRGRNLKMPFSWSGGAHIGNMSYPGRVELFNFDWSDASYRFLKKTDAGELREEITVVRSTGATDGAVPYSWKVVTNGNAKYPLNVFETFELPARRFPGTTAEVAAWVPGAAITVTIPFVHDSLTALTDADIRLSLQFLGTSGGGPLSVFANDGPVSVLAPPANQTVSSATWTTTGLVNPNKQELSVTFTPDTPGYLQGVVVVCKPSTTVYICAKMLVT